jgi:hypothetical protein
VPASSGGLLPVTSAKSYELLNRKQQSRFSAELNAKDLARYFDSLRRKGVRYTHFETSPPRELFNDGVRLYTFVPYARAIEFPEDKRWSSTISFLIALSADQGKTWTFVDGEGLTPEQIRYILPSYADQTIPPTTWRDGTTDWWRSELRNEDAARTVCVRTAG